MLTGDEDRGRNSDALLELFDDAAAGDRVIEGAAVPERAADEEHRTDLDWNLSALNVNPLYEMTDDSRRTRLKPWQAKPHRQGDGRESSKPWIG